MWPTYATGIRRGFLEYLGDDGETLRRALERVARGQSAD
jgi:hypothetical protein